MKAALVRESRSELCDNARELDKMLAAGCGNVTTDQRCGHRLPVASETVGPPRRMRDRPSHVGDRSLVLRNVAQLNEEPHRRVGLHESPAFVVPCAEAGY